MSNKLYTEEKIRQKLYLMGYFDDEQIENFINDLTPIELPTDDEIENMAIEYFNDAEGIEYEKGFYKIGAKWMKSKIQGGNNEL